MEFRVCTASVFVLCVIVVSATARHHHGHRDEQKQEYMEHFKRVNNYRSESSCSVPKETIVQLTEVTFPQLTLANEKISPKNTVLHRCESCLGCNSNPGHSCTAKTSEMVNLTFLVTTINGSHKDFRIGSAQNHTSCWCQPTSSQPK